MHGQNGRPWWDKITCKAHKVEGSLSTDARPAAPKAPKTLILRPIMTNYVKFAVCNLSTLQAFLKSQNLLFDMLTKHAPGAYFVKGGMTGSSEFGYCPTYSSHRGGYLWRIRARFKPILKGAALLRYVCFVCFWTRRLEAAPHPTHTRLRAPR